MLYAAKQRLATMKDNAYVFLVMSKQMLPDPARGLSRGFLAHEMGLITPPLVRAIIDITVGAIKVAPTGNFQKE
jgi:hypothetical protein